MTKKEYIARYSEEAWKEQLEKVAEWRQNNKEKLAEWRQNNKEKLAEYYICKYVENGNLQAIENYELAKERQF